MIVGINNYADPAITNLKGAVNDAQEVRDRLMTTGAFYVADSHYLTDEHATAASVREAVSDLLWKADQHELSLLYFSGHGFTDGYGNGFIAPCDMIRASPPVHGIRMSELRDLMLKAKNKQTIVLIFDCCYSGIAAEGEKAVFDTSVEVIDEGFGFDASPQSMGSGRVIYASAGSDERSRENSDFQHKFGGESAHPHGLFTFALIEGLDGGATDGDRVTLGSLIRYVDASLQGNGTGVEPRQYGSQTNALEKIFICTPKRQQDLTRHLAEVRKILEETDRDSLCHPMKLFRAIELLENVIADSPLFSEADELRSMLDKHLMSYRQPAIDIIVRNYMEIAYDCESTCDRLHEIVATIDYDSVTSLDKEFRNVIVVLLKVATGRVALRLLQVSLTGYHNYLRSLTVGIDRSDNIELQR
ncbi:caspase family protein [Mycobacterium intracellulare]|uniref:caspase family protein n=1 Tax=Mycobacterium intracellulare TaxID=1767 RepID=UPI001D8CD8EC|nr:caspase family protein [Mycobacterium intracellulare]MCA2249984.1 caspase family protein [Mycobacterium intracellulare]